ncbi:MAG TPA: malto-oligosyltrehalose trehalohydrolase [Kineosporiaceae bacterium]|nr:malto-oligosyltrehalose trehalohydrolase [Kineosporiaceae bacterium]
MHLFRVWAPAATAVDLVLPTEDRRLPMVPADGGWWALEVPGTGHGTDYAFSLEGGPARPDPRSPWQPAGVHGPSRVFDPARHHWNDTGWTGRDARGCVIYELHVGTFTAEGTLDAAATRLDHLVALGVDLVELMPVAAFDGRWGWGYDGVAPYAVHEPYGGPAALQRFVDAAHVAGLAVCLDVVYNHLGPSGNYLPEFGPYFTDRHRTPWGSAVNLDDDGRVQVRRWICDNALRWLRDFHLDALRLDAVHALADDSPRHLLAQLSDEVAELSRTLRRPLSLIAESDLNDPRMIEPTRDGGLGMTAQWDDDVHHALHTALTGERQGYYVDFGSPQVLARTLTRVFRHAGDWSTFRGRAWGRPVDPARHRGHRFVVCLQNHDQVGNRATGDRIGASLPPGGLAIGAALVLTSPYTPLLFMGEEWAAGTPWPYFTDFPDPTLGRAVSRGRLEEFAAHGWTAGQLPDPQDPATRRSAVLDWSEPGREPHAALLAWYRDLIALRRKEPDLRDDDLSAVRVETGGTWVRMRRGRLHVVANLGPEPVTVPLPAPAPAVPATTAPAAPAPAVPATTTPAAAPAPAAPAATTLPEDGPPPAGAELVLAWGAVTLPDPGHLLLPGWTVAIVRVGRPGAGDGRIGTP